MTEKSMKVIILNGWHGTGKTATMQMLFAVLDTNNATIQRFSIIPNSNGRDFEAELTFKSKTVAIFSSGDIQKVCNATIAKYVAKNIDVLIMPYSSFVTPPIIPKPHTSITIKKTIASKQVSKIQANAIDCKDIYYKI
jgi:hypothetical protein